MTFHARITLFSVLSLASCNLAPKLDKPAPALPVAFKTQGPWTVARPRDDESRGNWWRLFGDSRLSVLMQEAEKNSPSLELARQRVLEARATARADRSGLFPTMNLGAGARRDRGSGTMAFQFAGGRSRTTLSHGIDFSYELDFWGKNKNTAAAGLARAEAADAALQSARLGLLSELAMNYYALRAQDAQIALLRRTVAVRQRTMEMARKRFEQGDIAQIDVAQAETDHAETQAEAIGLERERGELEHAIALLLGRVPSDFSLPQLVITGSPPSLPKSVPSTLLERRPDIAAAERQMAARNAEIGVARAAYYPSITLGLSGGMQTSFIDKIADAKSRVWGLGPAGLDWPLLNGGAVKAGAQVAQARYDQSAAEYRQTVLTAMREAEDALTALSVLKRQSAAQDNTVSAATRALELSQKRYEAGLVAYYEVLDAQRTLLRSERESTRLKGELFLATVLLVKALGGGF
jgi:multidrug efflux system outer membrane protein